MVSVGTGWCGAVALASTLHGDDGSRVDAAVAASAPDGRDSDSRGGGLSVDCWAAAEDPALECSTAAAGDAAGTGGAPGVGSHPDDHDGKLGPPSGWAGVPSLASSAAGVAANVAAATSGAWSAVAPSPDGVGDVVGFVAGGAATTAAAARWRAATIRHASPAAAAGCPSPHSGAADAATAPAVTSAPASRSSTVDRDSDRRAWSTPPAPPRRRRGVRAAVATPATPPAMSTSARAASAASAAATACRNSA